MRTWFTVALVLILGAILVALSIPAVSVGIGRTETTEILNNCRQLQIAVEEYFDKNGRSPSNLSALLDERFIDDDLFHSLTDGKGVYLIYFREDMKKEDVFIEAFNSKIHVKMTAGGGGTVTRNNYQSKKYK